MSAIDGSLIPINQVSCHSDECKKKLLCSSYIQKNAEDVGCWKGGKTINKITIYTTPVQKGWNNLLNRVFKERYYVAIEATNNIGIVEKIFVVGELQGNFNNSPQLLRKIYSCYSYLSGKKALANDNPCDEKTLEETIHKGAIENIRDDIISDISENNKQITDSELKAAFLDKFYSIRPKETVPTTPSPQPSPPMPHTTSTPKEIPKSAASPSGSGRRRRRVWSLDLTAVTKTLNTFQKIPEPSKSDSDSGSGEKPTARPRSLDGDGLARLNWGGRFGITATKIFKTCTSKFQNISFSKETTPSPQPLPMSPTSTPQNVPPEKTAPHLRQSQGEIKATIKADSPGKSEEDLYTDAISMLEKGRALPGTFTNICKELLDSIEKSNSYFDLPKKYQKEFLTVQKKCLEMSPDLQKTFFWKRAENNLQEHVNGLSLENRLLLKTWVDLVKVFKKGQQQSSLTNEQLELAHQFIALLFMGSSFESLSQTKQMIVRTTVGRMISDEISFGRTHVSNQSRI